LSVCEYKTYSTRKKIYILALGLFFNLTFKIRVTIIFSGTFHLRKNTISTFSSYLYYKLITCTHLHSKINYLYLFFITSITITDFEADFYCCLYVGYTVFSAWGHLDMSVSENTSDLHLFICK